MALTSWRSQFLNKSNKKNLQKGKSHVHRILQHCLYMIPPACSCDRWYHTSALASQWSLKSHQFKCGRRCVDPAPMSQHWPWGQSAFFAAPDPTRDFAMDPRWHAFLADLNDYRALQNFSRGDNNP